MELRIKLKNVLRIIGRHIVLLIGIISLSIAAGVSWNYLIKKPEYQSQIQFLQTNNDTSQITVYDQILSLKSFKTQVNSELKQRKISSVFSDTTIESMSVSSSVNSPIFSVSVTTRNPKFSKYAATIVAQNLISFVGKYQGAANLAIISKAASTPTMVQQSISKIVIIFGAGGLVLSLCIVFMKELYGKKMASQYLNDIFGIENLGSIKLLKDPR
ncbi:hypothetical protein RXV91_00105 [Lactiplantibacillus sp. DA1]|uniref:hypothetical protein n=1 Tax=Lactiplantibacillus sp. DA1 TaxID=3079857 RepID=UPI00292A5EDC|nr:hypothetical protein [Lactiplantibacillus sp. DA1]MDV0429288.1 hypothetical protein [Lactiplantibacillus sp. DA1]